MSNTPLPWRIDPAYGVVGANGTQVNLADFGLAKGSEARENTKLVIEAVNAHSKLQRDRNALLESMEYVQKYWRVETGAILKRVIDDAIAQAEKED